MTFPQTALPITVELNLAGTWTDISTYVYSRDSIVITRGRSSEGASVDRGTASLTLNNRDGRFTPKNPTGPYYGKIGRNTPLRISVDAGLPWLSSPDGSAARASTPDASPIDITGDIDMRMELEPDEWTASSGVRELAGRYQPTGNLVSWLWTLLADGRMQLWWSPNGTTASLQNAISTAAASFPRRGAVRATLDVDNGSGGWTATFYTASSITGTWTQLGTPVVNSSGTTSLFNTSAPLEVGDVQNVGYPNPARKIYKFELRNGLGGTVVANLDFTAQTPGATSFTDGAGRTWSATSGALTNRRIRFVGEVSEWPPRWTSGGQDVWAPVQAAGILRRLNQGSSPLQSPMRREFSNPARSHIVAYWPCEDGTAAVQFASAIPGGQPLTITVPGVTPAADSSWVASDALPTMGPGTLRGTLPTYTSTGQIALRIAVRLPSGGVSGSTRLVSIRDTGTAAVWSVWVNSTAQLALRAHDSSATQILDTGFGTYYNNGDLLSLGVELTQSGSDVVWKMVVYRLADFTLNATVPNLFVTGTLTGRTAGRATSVVIGEDGGLGSTVVGHVAVADDTTAYASTANALIGQAGETVLARVSRLATEEQLNLTTAGTGADLMGPQRLASLVSLLQQAADIGGTLYEQREAVGLAFRARDVDYNQTPMLAVAYSALPQGLEPTDDDQQVRNDITVTRDQGGSGRATVDTGALSTAAPPNGVGRYDSSVSLNLYTDDQTTPQAAWRAYLGTVDATRYPVIPVDLARRPDLIADAASVDVCDRITISGAPSWLPPGLIDEQVLGYTETLAQFTWTIRFNCGPAAPLNVATADDAVYGRADTDGSQLAAAVSTTTATSLSVATTTSGPLWTTSAGDFPFDITVGGEVMTVTNITGSSSPQTFTVTRSVNGVQKTHTSGEDVRLAYPSAAAL